MKENDAAGNEREEGRKARNEKKKVSIFLSDSLSLLFLLLRAHFPQRSSLQFGKMSPEQIVPAEDKYEITVFSIFVTCSFDSILFGWFPCGWTCVHNVGVAMFLYKFMRIH